MFNEIYFVYFNFIFSDIWRIMTSTISYYEIENTTLSNFTNVFQNSTPGATEKDIQTLSPLLYLFICVVAALCSAVTVCGNLLVILSFIVNRTMRNFSNYLILNLAISDMIIGKFLRCVNIIYNLYINRIKIAFVRVRKVIVFFPKCAFKLHLSQM